MSWFDSYRTDWRKGMGMDGQQEDMNLGRRPIDMVSLELDTIEEIFRGLKALSPTARLRVFRYVEALLSEEP